MLHGKPLSPLLAQPIEYPLVRAQQWPRRVPYAIVMTEAGKPRPVVLSKRAWQVALAGLVCFAVLDRVVKASPPRFFMMHVACMAPMLPLGVGAVSTIRQRLVKPPSSKLTEPGARKRRSEWLVIRHFITSASAFYVASAGLYGIWRHKNMIGRAHFRSPHSWLGLTTWLVWMIAYASAQPKVWRDQWRDRKFSLWSNKRWLWASVTHRRLGTVAYATSLAAYTTGILGWKAIGRPLAFACAAAITAIGVTTLGQAGVKEVSQSVRVAVASLVRLVPGIPIRREDRMLGQE